jgi:hypothetical protein
LADADINLSLLKSLSAQLGGVDTVANVAFGRRNNAIKAAIKILDNPNAPASTKDRALVAMDTNLQAVRAQEATQIDKTTTLSITLKPIADSLAALDKAQDALALASGASSKTAAQALVTQAMARVSQVVKSMADLIASDKTATDAWTQALMQANKAQKVIDTYPADSAAALFAQQTLAKANSSLDLAERSATLKAAAEKVYADNLDALLKTQAAAQAAFDSDQQNPQHPNATAVLQALTQANAALDKSITTMANTLGTTRNCTGSVRSMVMASICSVTFMVPSSAA